MAIFDDSETVTTFPGPAENPISLGGTWAETTPDRPQLAKTAGPLGSVTNVTGNVAYSTYIAEQYNSVAPIGVFGCMDGGQLGAALETWRVHLFTAYSTSAITGYLVYQGGALSKDTVVRRYDGSINTFTVIAAAANTDYPQRLGLAINGDHIEAWLYTTGFGWSLACSTAGPGSLTGGSGDTTYRGNFYGGLGIEENNLLGFTCFGAVVDEDLPQIYRRPNE